MKTFFLLFHRIGMQCCFLNHQLFPDYIISSQRCFNIIILHINLAQELIITLIKMAYLSPMRHCVYIVYLPDYDRCLHKMTLIARCPCHMRISCHREVQWYSVLIDMSWQLPLWKLAIICRLPKFLFCMIGNQRWPEQFTPDLASYYCNTDQFWLLYCLVIMPKISIW